MPSLLILNPEQALSSLNLEQYTVLDCEPIHDIKGHLANLFEELPYILAAEVRKKCEALLETKLSGGKVTGGDLRTTSIQVLLLLTNEGASSQLILLLTTIVKISEILYSDEEIRTPRRVLQLYNTTWLHLELCRELFPVFRRSTKHDSLGFISILWLPIHQYSMSLCHRNQ